MCHAITFHIRTHIHTILTHSDTCAQTYTHMVNTHDEEAKKKRYLHFQNFSDDKGKLIFSGVTLHSNLAKHASQTLEVLGIYLTSILKNYQTLIFSRMPRHFFSFKILKVEIPLFFASSSCMCCVCIYK